MSQDRTRHTHPDPAWVGDRFIGDLGGARQGRPFTQEHTGTLAGRCAPWCRCTAGSGDRRGTVVALVSVRITTERIADALAARLPSIVLAGGLVLAVGLLEMSAGTLRRDHGPPGMRVGALGRGGRAGPGGLPGHRRRSLEYLAAESMAGRTVRYGGSGRPEAEYRWTGA